MCREDAEQNSGEGAGDIGVTPEIIAASREKLLGIVQRRTAWKKPRSTSALSTFLRLVWPPDLIRVVRIDSKPPVQAEAGIDVAISVIERTFGAGRHRLVRRTK